MPNDLEKVGSAWWEMTMSDSPTWATHLGDRRFDHRLEDLSLAAQSKRLKRTSEFVSRLQTLDRGSLSTRDRVLYDVLHTKLKSTLATAQCRDADWNIDPLWGPHIQLAQLPTSHSIRGPEDVATLAQRYRASPALLTQHQANLERGLTDGFVAARVAVSKVVSQVERLVKGPAGATPFMTSVRFPKAWTKAQVETARGVLARAVEEAVLPALRRYRAFLLTDYLPRSRATDVGASFLPGGAGCYGAKIVASTGSSKTPQQIHDLGLQELRRLRKAMSHIAKELTGTDDLRAFMAGLAAQPDQSYGDAKELLADAQTLMDRAFAKLPTMFGRLPRTRITVTEMEAYRAKDAPAAFYNPAPADGSRSAQYIVNTHAPTSRPRYNMAALSFHEAVPGHHLQIAIARETTGIPPFQRFMGQTAYVEGWALYAELLAAEMGLYRSPMEHFGKLNFQAWRACRLVVDTGIHAFGWSRQRAIDFMVANTANSAKDVEVEIDRYIVWPGQALGYMMGRMAIQGLRARAERRLGTTFDLKSFHDEVLGYGPVPIAVLTGIIDRYIENRAP